MAKYFIDPMLYSETYFSGDKVKFEPKIILTKRSLRVIGVVNINFEIEKDIPASLTESKFEVTSGLAYEVSANFVKGLELRNHVNFQDIYSSKKNEALYSRNIKILKRKFLIEKFLILTYFNSPVSYFFIVNLRTSNFACPKLSKLLMSCFFNMGKK